MPRWEAASQRWHKNVDKTASCWNWTGSISDTGYGCFFDGRAYSTHRYAYAMHKGEIPVGLVVMHTCDNRRCVNPDHLVVGTKRDNSQDMSRKGRSKPSMLRGQEHGEAKLTDAAVIEILTCRTTPGRVLARKFGVSESAVSLVRRGASWQHIARRLDQMCLDFGAGA